MNSTPSMAITASVVANFFVLMAGSLYGQQGKPTDYDEMQYRLANIEARLKQLAGKDVSNVPIPRQPLQIPTATERPFPAPQPTVPLTAAELPPAPPPSPAAITISESESMGEVPETTTSNQKDYYLGFRVGPRASTLGAGLEIAKGFTPRLGARMGFNYFTYDYSDKVSDIDYNFDLRLQSLALLADWHPFKGMFRISTGAIFNGARLKMLADLNPTSPEEINGVPYKLDSVNGTLKFNSVAPYLGLGWDTTFGDDDSWGLTFDVGVLYHGSPELQISASGPDASLPNFSSDLEQERLDLQNDLADFRFWPVVSAGFLYQF